MQIDLAIAVGSFLGLIATTSLQSVGILGTSDSMLVHYARQQGVIAAWMSSRRRQCAGLGAAWAATALMRILAAHRSGELDTCTSPCAILLSARLLSTGIFLSVTGVMLHVCSGLALFIDSFCSSLASQWDVEGSVIAWNLLQAVLRRTSSAIATGFLIIQTTTLSVVLFAMLGYVRNDLGWEWLVAVSVLMLCDAHLLFKAGKVTDKCSRVPPLVNSLDFSNCATLDKQRLYLVEYVTYSAAGFYVGETRLTSSMALKLVYVSVICAFGLFSKVLGGGELEDSVQG